MTSRPSPLRPDCLEAPFHRPLSALRQRPLAGLLAVACLTVGLATARADATGQGASVAGGMRLVPLDVRVNGYKSGAWALLDKDGELHATEDALQEWRIERRPDQAAVRYRGQNWYPLKSVTGYAFRLNPVEQSVDLMFAPEAFSATRLGQDPQPRSAQAVATPEPALFLNIDASTTAQRARGGGSLVELGALTELGFSHRWGVFTTSHVWRQGGGAGGAPRATRLESSFVHDFPARHLTLRVGDTVSRAGLWGGSVYFGGVQLSRNFALSPGFVTQPIPSLVGTSATPSTVSVYVNDVLRQTSTVPSGPFAIDNFPLLTGNGQARLVVRDLLGRETVIEQPFFTHASLLEPGLSDWSIEAGALRRNLGTTSGEYGNGFGSGLWRRGITPRFTLDAQAVWSAALRGAGLGGTFALPWQALGQAGLRASQSTTHGSGHEWLIGMEGEHRRHTFGLRAVGRSGGFRTLDAGPDDTATVRAERSASYSYTSERFGVTGLAFSQVRSGTSAAIATLSASHAWRIGGQGALSVNMSRVLGGGGVFFGVSYSQPLDGRRSTASAATWRAGQLDAYTSVSQSPDTDLGTGWRVLSGYRNAGAYGEAGFHRQAERWLVTGNASASAGQQTVRLGAQGALVWMDGRIFASRYLQDSFALVEVAGYADVGVGFQGNTLTRTDANGQALLPRLMAYQPNSIRLDPSELPISAELDDIEEVVVPPWRSGVKVTFPVRSGRAALLRIELDDGEPAPAGAMVTLPRDADVFYVARRGEAFVTGLGPSTPMQLHWNGQLCDFKVDLPPGAIDDIARVGPIACRGVAR